MISLHVTVGADSFALEGDVSMAELVALVTQWYGVLPSIDDDTLRTLTAQLSQSTTALAHAEAADAATHTTKE
jgi:hypothetical protein